MAAAPLIVTLTVDLGRARFDELCPAHFPAASRSPDAHVTLFHALPGNRVNDVDRSVADAARRDAFAIRVTGVRLLEWGVALDLRSPGLDAVHARLRAQWEPGPTSQDAVPLHAHVTVQDHVAVQNQAAGEVTRALHADLSAGFTPYDIVATGLALWRCRTGLREPVSRHAFR